MTSPTLHRSDDPGQAIADQPTLDRRGLVVFVALAFGLSWAWVIALAATGHTVYQGRGWPTHIPGLLAPLIAAFAVTGWRYRRAGWRDLWSRMTRWRIGWRWWLAALSPVAFLGVGLLIVGLSGTGEPSSADFARFSGVPSGIGVVLVAVVIVVVNGYGEETGWRGYALPQLQARYSPLAATLILAGVWAAWHIPQFFLIDSYKGFSPPMLPVFVIGLACGSVILTWIYNRTGGSILAVVVWHGLYNMAGATKAATQGTGAISAVVWTLVVIQGTILIIAELRARRRGHSVIKPVWAHR